MVSNLHLSEILPEWMLSRIKDRKCSECYKVHDKDDVYSMGMRQNKDKTFDLYVEQSCSDCDHISVTIFKSEINNNIEDMCFILLEQVKLRRMQTMSLHSENHSLKNPKTRMTDKEISGFLKFIKKSKNHDDFLKRIGAYSLSKNMCKDNPRKK